MLTCVDMFVPTTTKPSSGGSSGLGRGAALAVDHDAQRHRVVGGEGGAVDAGGERTLRGGGQRQGHQTQHEQSQQNEAQCLRILAHARRKGAKAERVFCGLLFLFIVIPRNSMPGVASMDVPVLRLQGHDMSCPYALPISTCQRITSVSEPRPLGSAAQLKPGTLPNGRGSDRRSARDRAGQERELLLYESYQSFSTAPLGKT
jgi:hypothetical protein